VLPSFDFAQALNSLSARDGHHQKHYRSKKDIVGLRKACATRRRCRPATYIWEIGDIDARSCVGYLCISGEWPPMLVIIYLGSVLIDLRIFFFRLVCLVFCLPRRMCRRRVGRRRWCCRLTYRRGMRWLRLSRCVS
jgi:hypothetical protein